MCDSACLAEKVIFAISILLTPFYIGFLSLLFIKRNNGDLSQPFFRIVFVLGVADLLLVWSILTFQQPFWWFVNLQDNTAILIVTIAINWAKLSQACAIINMTINRFVAIIWSNYYEIVSSFCGNR